MSGWDQNVLQQIRDQVLGLSNTKFGDLNETVYMQQIIQALLGQPQVGPYGSLHRRIYLERMRDVLTAVLATYPKGQLLKTGQLTSYGSGAGVDDGALKKGIAKSYTVLSTGQYAGNTNITINSKTDAHTNACVMDNNTGLMWSRAYSASVGPASNGLLPWTTTGSGGTAEGIFPYVAAANAASLSGYTDWRIPNVYELLSIADYEAPNGVPNPTAFASWGTVVVWTASTWMTATTQAYYVDLSDASLRNLTKTNANGVAALVRG